MTQKHGVEVYDYRTQEEKAQPLDLSRWQLSPWTKWVAVIDNSGEVWEYEDEPRIAVAMWHWGDGSRAQCIDTIDLTGIDWRLTLTPVSQAQPEPQPWCAQCNLPEEICRGHDRLPSPTVETIVVLWQQLDAMQELDLASARIERLERKLNLVLSHLGISFE